MKSPRYVVSEILQFRRVATAFPFYLIAWVMYGCVSAYVDAFNHTIREYNGAGCMPTVNRCSSTSCLVPCVTRQHVSICQSYEDSLWPDTQYVQVVLPLIASYRSIRRHPPNNIGSFIRAVGCSRNGIVTFMSMFYGLLSAA